MFLSDYIKFILSPHFHKNLQYISKKSVHWKARVAKHTWMS